MIESEAIKLKVELDSDKSRFRDIFNLNEDEKYNLSEAIKSTNGTVEIWVHTHYDSKYAGDEEDTKAYDEYLKNRDKFITQGNKGKMPIIAMIEANPLIPGMEENIEEYEGYYNGLNEENSDNPIYFVKTFQDHSVPCVVNQDDYSVLKEDTRLDNWNEFGNLLASLGVTKIILRGRNFEYEQKNRISLDTANTIYVQNNAGSTMTEDPLKAELPGKCVGDAKVNLSVRGFKMLNSSLTYPEQSK